MASIIGTVSKEEPTSEEVKTEVKEDEKPELVQEDTKKEEDTTEVTNEEVTLPVVPTITTTTVDSEDLIQLEDLRGDLDPVCEVFF